MDISQVITETNKAYQKNAKPGDNTLGSDDFMRLLITQLQNQDPTNPMDSQQFAAQLAQFNTVEQLTDLNNGMTTLNTTQQTVGNALSNTMAASLTGKEIKGRTDALKLEPGQDTDVKFNLDGVAADVTLTITDDSGHTVRTVSLKNRNTGDQSWTWDGKDDSGHQLPEGTYHVSVQAANGDTQVAAYPFVEGKVSKVQYSKDGVNLVVNGVNVNMGNVEEVSDSADNE